MTTQTTVTTAPVVYKNPVNVGVAIVPVVDDEGRLIGAVGCRRNIQPFIGGVAMPGGFQNEMRTVRQTVHSEVQEEIGIEHFELDKFQWVDERMTPNNRNLVFFEYTGVPLSVQEVAEYNAKLQERRAYDEALLARQQLGETLNEEELAFLENAASTCRENQEILVLTPDMTLCFNLHEEVLAQWFAKFGLYRSATTEPSV